MNNVFLSVVIPVYNGEKYIGKCIDSVIKNDIINLEIIIINDGSTDRSDELIKDYYKKNKNIKYINKRNGGVSSARNIGIKNSIGKYITFVDCDDYCSPNMFKVMINEAISNDSDLIYIGYSIENEKGKKIQNVIPKRRLGVTNKDDIADVLSNINLAYPFSKMYKRQILIENNIFFDEKISFGEDFIFVHKFIKYIKSISSIDFAAYHYIKTKKESLSAKYVTDIKKVAKDICKSETDVYNVFPKYKKNRQKNGLTLGIYETILCNTNNYKKNSNINFKDRIKYIKDIMKNEKLEKDIRNYKPNNLAHKIFKILYKIKSPILMDLVYKLIFLF